MVWTGAAPHTHLPLQRICREQPEGEIGRFRRLTTFREPEVATLPQLDSVPTPWLDDV